MSKKSWSFTINNYNDSDIKLLDDLEVSYIVYGKEVGELGTPHLQGFVTFRKSTRLPALKKIHPTAHWEPAKAEDAAANYCMKDKEYTIRDNREPGRRSDMIQFIEKIKETGLQEAVEEFPREYVKYHSGFDKLALRICKTKERQPPTVIWLYGDTGAGKTRYVYDHHPLDDIWQSGTNLKWYDRYHGQPVALLDDFREKNIEFSFLLRLLDRYPLTVEVKGGTTIWSPQIIYITSSRSPEHMYVANGEDNQQLLRRITHIVECRFGAEIEIPD